MDRPALGTSLAILALVVLATLLRLGRTLFLRKRPRLAPQSGTIWLTAGPRVAAFGWLILLGTIAGYFAIAGDDILPPTPDWFLWFEVMNVATGIAIFLSLFAILKAVFIWFRSDLRAITKIKFTLVGLSCLVLVLFSIHWNLIGPPTASSCCRCFCRCFCLAFLSVIPEGNLLFSPFTRTSTPPAKLAPYHHTRPLPAFS